jgi:uncharacterized membrane protein
METSRLSAVGIALVACIFIAAFLIAVYGTLQADFLLALENVVLILLTTAINFLYVIGAGLIVLGSILVFSRYVKSKIKSPFQPFAGLPRARYLTVSLEIFIGAEIIKTVVARSIDEFILLSFTIGIRGLVAVILYLERRWHGDHPDHTTPAEPASI